MIELSRQQIYQIRSTFRHCLGRTSRKPLAATFQGTPEALLIRSATDQIGIEYQVPGSFPSVCVTVPFDALTACEGRRSDAVRLESAGDEVIVRWMDANIPQVVQFRTQEPILLPELPAELSAIEREFLDAMADACETTEADSQRYALNCVRLRGADGQIAATDGRQALLQTGFMFPWTDEILIPATKVFATKALRDARQVSIGRTDEWLVVRADNWTVTLKIEMDRRFPAIDGQVPDVQSASTTMVLADTDADFLLRATPRLPGAGQLNAPVTLDLNGAVVVRSKADAAATMTDLVLRSSQRRGNELKVSSDRRFIQRALQLGFREVHFRDVETPAFCRSDRRVYLWAVLGKENVLQPDANAVRIESPLTPRTNPSTVAERPESLPHPTNAHPFSRSRIAMTPSPTKTQEPLTRDKSGTHSQTLTALIDEGERLRTTLREVLSRTNVLVTGLKRQRQHTNAMRTALKSLRAVQAIES